MGVTQISKIQHKRGPASDLPKGSVENPVGLSDGEFGITDDTGELFIGTPNLPHTQHRKPTPENQTGTFPYTNTQVLTEWSPNTEKLLQYVYRNRYNGDTQASPFDDNNAMVSRALQERLDERVSVKSYGAVGDGVIDDTFAIWSAMVDCTRVLVSMSPLGLATTSHPRAVYFPAGTYRITRPILIPPGSSMYGDGPNNSAIVLAPTIVNSAINCVAETCDSSLLLETILDTWLLDPPVKPNGTEFNIGTGATSELPTGIYVKDLTFKSNIHSDVIHLNRASNTKWVNCAFVGGNTDYDKPPATYTHVGTNIAVTMDPNAAYISEDTIGVFIDGLGDVVDPHNHSFIGCGFRSTTYGISMTDQIKDVLVSECHFGNHYRAISLGEIMTTDNAGLHTIVDQEQLIDGEYGGPSGVKIVNSTFDYITSDAVYVDYGQNVTIQGNTFHDTIGRGFSYYGTAISPIISYGPHSREGVISNNWFGRENHPTIPNIICNTGEHEVNGGYYPNATAPIGVGTNQELSVAIRVNSARTWFNMRYHVKDTIGVVQHGIVTIIVDYDDDTPSTSSWYIADTATSAGLTFSGELVNLNEEWFINLRYSSTFTGTFFAAFSNK